MTKPGKGFKDLVGGFGPYEGIRVMIVDLQVVPDRGFEFAGAAEGAAANSLVGQRPEPALDQINPGGAGGSEVHLEARPLGQPVADKRGLVGSVIVHNQVDRERLGDIGVDGVEEFTELYRAMATMTLTDHGAGFAVERGEQAGGAMAGVIVGAPLGLPGPHRQQWLGAIQGLDLALLVGAQDHRPVGRI